MEIRSGGSYFVRIDTQIGDQKISDQDLRDHLKYVGDVASRQYFVGGGFMDRPGGMCFFEAESLEAAHSIVRNDPVIKRGFYSCELYEWKPTVMSG